MKHNQIAILSVIQVAGMLLSLSCNKTNPFVRENLVGTWTLNTLAIDSNRNEIVDNNELIALPDTAKIYLALNADGTAGYFTKNWSIHRSIVLVFNIGKRLY